MVIDTLENLALYCGLHSDIALIREFIEQSENLPEGRYDFGSGNHMLIHEGETRDGTNALFEVHDRYLDLQVVGKGAERVEWAERSTLVQNDPVDSAKDIGFYRGEGDGFDVMAGMFYIVFPQDAHKANCHTRLVGSCDYRKYIFKLRIK